MSIKLQLSYEKLIKAVDPDNCDYWECNRYCEIKNDEEDPSLVVMEIGEILNPNRYRFDKQELLKIINML